MNLLITGAAGFIGSNFVFYFLEKYRNHHLVILDLLTYAGDMRNLESVKNHSQQTFVKGDICNRELVEYLFDTYNIGGVIHFAAESHVDNSIKNPDVFLKTNVMGTHTLLDVALKKWGGKDYRFHHISTDEVYGTLGETGLFTEATPYAPNSPYSASKAGSDMIVRAYHHTYGMNTVITNCSNNYGPRQHYEKLIPTIIRNALEGKPIPIYGDGKNVRDWLYVMDHCSGIDLAYHKGRAGETYNIGGKNEWQNIDIAHKICRLLDDARPKPTGSYVDQITHVRDRLGHDRRYAIDATKIETELGWKAEENFESGIAKTIAWYQEHGFNA